ncbi:membrane protein [Companilactobacillus sp. RD055328]|uniref:YoaK family protein n=1 Tax=Companilactobacillus sp. RD055328 TaxID=2916634 RepID=UPI001FC8CB77|nr:YoaK family protein [Companilactobacillus sp. RD055328]GKQ43380.1 membrane protein [Companilactobacillus sp. RD055328]
MNSSSPIHERTIVAELLAMASGSIDAYSYLTHGQVFAGMQTGNLILMGINLAEFKWAMVVNYFIPILVYIFGTTITKYASMKFTNYHGISRQELVLGVDIFLLIVVGLLADRVPLLLTSLFMSFCIAILFTEFNKIHGMPLTAVMMTGNFKKMGNFILEGILKKDTTLLRRGFRTFKIILAFFMGVIINATLVRYLSFQAIFFSAIILAIILSTITYENRKIIKEFAEEIS